MQKKERHGFLTGWLIFMIMMNTMLALTYFLGSSIIPMLVPHEIPKSVMMMLAIIGLANVVFAVLLFRWKKAGFRGFVGSSVATFSINIYIGLGIGQSMAGLIGVVLLYGILQLKENNVSGWDNLA